MCSKTYLRMSALFVLDGVMYDSKYALQIFPFNDYNLKNKTF